MIRSFAKHHAVAIIRLLTSFDARSELTTRMLHPGGLLVVEHSRYRVEDLAPEFSLASVG